MHQLHQGGRKRMAQSRLKTCNHLVALTYGWLHCSVLAPKHHRFLACFFMPFIMFPHGITHILIGLASRPKPGVLLFTQLAYAWYGWYIDIFMCHHLAHRPLVHWRSRFLRWRFMDRGCGADACHGDNWSQPRIRSVVFQGIRRVQPNWD